MNTFIENLDLDSFSGFKSSYNIILEHHKSDLEKFVGLLTKDFSFEVFRKNIDTFDSGIGVNFSTKKFKITYFDVFPKFNNLEKKLSHEFDVLHLISLSAIFNYHDSLKLFTDSTFSCENLYLEKVYDQYISKSNSISKVISMFYFNNYYFEKEEKDIFENKAFYNYIHEFIPRLIVLGFNEVEKKIYNDFIDLSKKSTLSPDLFKKYHKYILSTTKDHFEDFIYDDGVFNWENYVSNEESRNFFNSIFSLDFSEEFFIKSFFKR